MTKPENNLSPGAALGFLGSAWFRGFLFPQIPRFFSATVPGWLPRLFLWTGLITLLTVNLQVRMTTLPTFWSAVRTALLQPRSPTPHLELALVYKNIGYDNMARRQLLYAQDLINSPRGTLSLSERISVLGAFTQPADLLATWDQEARDLIAAEVYWRKIIEDYPLYRDAYLTLSAISYRLGNMSEATEYLAKASSLDPNYPLLNQLIELVK